MQEISLPDHTFIAGWIFNDTTICDKIINAFEKNIQYAVSGSPGDGEWSNTKGLKDLELLLNHFPNEAELYHNQLQMVCDKYIEKFTSCNWYSSWGIYSPIKLQKYNPGDGYYDWHTERDSALVPYAYRHLVFMTYLNDVSDQGETEFFNQKLKIKPKKGLTLIWPADWTHTHRGIPSQTQTKYIVTGWYSFKDTNRRYF